MSTLVGERGKPAPAHDPSTQALIQGLFARISEVSSIPEVAIQIVQLADDPLTGAEDLFEAIGQDPALAMRIMRTVNSSYYGLPKHVADLKRAITLLGFKEIRNLVLSAYIADLFKRGAGHGTYTRRGLWEHLVGAAAVARLIAQRSGKVPPQEAYLAGLLHDFGLILIDQYLHGPFCRVIDAMDTETPLCEVERNILGFDHTLLGEFVAARWRLPEQLTSAIRYHHQSELYDGPHATLVQAVQLANIFCHFKDRSPLGVRNSEMPSSRIVDGLELEKEQLVQIWKQVDGVLDATDSVMTF
jgi:HD-like signal output (HDOD) protein